MGAGGTEMGVGFGLRVDIDCDGPGLIAVGLIGAGDALNNGVGS